MCIRDRVADVVMPHGFMTDKYMRDVLLPNVAIGLKRGGRTWSDIEVTGGGFTVVGGEGYEDVQQLGRGVYQTHVDHSECLGVFRGRPPSPPGRIGEVGRRCLACHRPRP